MRALRVAAVGSGIRAYGRIETRPNGEGEGNTNLENSRRHPILFGNKSNVLRCRERGKSVSAVPTNLGLVDVRILLLVGRHHPDAILRRGR